MKKVLVLFIAVLLLVGCGEKKEEVIEEKSITCKMESKDVVEDYSVEAEYVIYYSDEAVNRVHTVEKVKTTSSDIKKSFKDTIEKTYGNMNKSYGGYTYNVDENGDELTSTTDIDYSKMNLEQYVKDQPSLKNYYKDGRLTLDGVKKIYTSLGAACE